VTVNGHTLLDEQLKSKQESAWELPLAGIDLGKTVTIELHSPSFVPAKTIPNSKDGRTLGIRVKRLVLLGEEGVQGR
jgi:hypothetical protein